jgi:hypothetical protein
LEKGSVHMAEYKRESCRVNHQKPH